MIIQNQNDPMTDMDMVHIFEDLKNEKELVLLDLEKKNATYDWTGKNPEKIVLSWFNKFCV